MLYLEQLALRYLAIMVHTLYKLYLFLAWRFPWAGRVSLSPCIFAIWVLSWYFLCSLAWPLWTEKRQDSLCSLQRTLTVGEISLPCHPLGATLYSNRRSGPWRTVRAGFGIDQSLSVWYSEGVYGSKATTGHRKGIEYLNPKGPSCQGFISQMEN